MDKIDNFSFYSMMSDMDGDLHLQDYSHTNYAIENEDNNKNMLNNSLSHHSADAMSTSAMSTSAMSTSTVNGGDHHAFHSISKASTESIDSLRMVGYLS